LKAIDPNAPAEAVRATGANKLEEILYGGFHQVSCRYDFPIPCIDLKANTFSHRCPHG